MVRHETRSNENKSLDGDKYARTEEELYNKALALLDKCKIESRRSDQEMPELEAAPLPPARYGRGSEIHTEALVA
jgi:hypothetical protein